MFSLTIQGVPKKCPQDLTDSINLGAFLDTLYLVIQVRVSPISWDSLDTASKHAPAPAPDAGPVSVKSNDSHIISNVCDIKHFLEMFKISWEIRCQMQLSWIYLRCSSFCCVQCPVSGSQYIEIEAWSGMCECKSRKSASVYVISTSFSHPIVNNRPIG